jgi:hypothetical protein
MSVATATKLLVIVHYVAAEHPFREHAHHDETVGELKKRVLHAFGLTEGQDASGDTVTYTLFHDKKPLENPHEKLTEVAHHHHELKLNLVQQITQGASL